ARVPRTHAARVIARPPSRRQSAAAMSEYDPGGQPTEPIKRCPNCQSPVDPNAQFCPSCGQDLTPKKSSFWPTLLIAIVALAAGAGIALAIAGTGNDNSTKTVTKRS